MRKTPQLYDFLLSQQSIHEQMPYDLVQKIIDDSIEYVKNNNINARISNVVFNINKQLVLAQVYVERRNAFATTKTDKFGASPTAYNVQVRFPFGLATRIGSEITYLPAGHFNNTLQPYMVEVIKDDVQRDFSYADLVCGPDVEKKLDPSGQIITLGNRRNRAESLMLPNSEIEGLGFTIVPGTPQKEYHYEIDYQLRLKKAGVAPLFYSGPSEDKKQEEKKAEKDLVIRKHYHYQGYTEYQGMRGENKHLRLIESRSDGLCEERKKAYGEFVTLFNESVVQSVPGQRWLQDLESGAVAGQYVWDITIVNGMTLFTESGLPLIRLRDYQLELFRNCMVFIEDSKTIKNHRPAAKIKMGVGAGKTFFTFTLLQQLRSLNRRQQKESKEKKENSVIMPPFCMAPDEDVANVTKTSINRQGVTTGVRATAIVKPDQMPDENFLKLYQSIAQQAQTDAKDADHFLQHTLQAEILNFCQQQSIHPHAIVNILYTEYRYGELTKKVRLFKDSIDIKRLILLVEGQKVIVNKTGMLGIEGLYNLLEQFKAIRKAIETESFFQESKEVKVKPLKINYNQPVSLPNYVNSEFFGGSINLAQERGKLADLLLSRYPQSLRATRDLLVRIACLGNSEAAVILANSGGLGNTYSQQELKSQVERFLPTALDQIMTLANKKEHSLRDHYTMYLYLNEIYISIPAPIRLNQQLDDQEDPKDPSYKPRDAFKTGHYHECLRAHLGLVEHIERTIQTKIDSFKKVSEIKCDSPCDFRHYGIQQNQNAIKAANQLAGIASLRITDSQSHDNGALLWTQVPVFTPEGLASYFEFLDKLEGQPTKNFKQHSGIYALEDNLKKITKKDIETRIEQVLNAMMVADEVHKEAFKFLYDTENLVYQRINAITKKYLRKEFIDVLPCRIGMTGTANEITEQAFGKMTLYDLSIQSMINQGLVKTIHVASLDTCNLTSESKDSQQIEEKGLFSEAKAIVVDYFSENCFDLFSVSKGLIFSKKEDKAFNANIADCFNLLIEEKLSEENEKLQGEIFAAINQKRTEKGSSPLSRDSLRALHRNAFHNNLFARYLEYLLSKSNAPKEFSDIIGLQNRLHEKKLSLTQAFQITSKNLKVQYGLDEKSIAEIENYVNSMRHQVDPQTITQEDITNFIGARVKAPEGLLDIMVGMISGNKNNYVRFLDRLPQETALFPLNRLITNNQDEFESGTTLVMLGSTTQQTGYSHEPVGIIVDAPSYQATSTQVNQYLRKLIRKEFRPEEVQPFLTSLQVLVTETFSYDEKNQVGGRALRTPHGHVQYIQYLSEIESWLGDLPFNSPLRALRVETPFQNIFTKDEDLAQRERRSITFNRMALTLLANPEFKQYSQFESAIRTAFAKPLSQPDAKNDYEVFIIHRLSFLWAMKWHPNLVFDVLVSVQPLALCEISKQSGQKEENETKEQIILQEAPVPEEQKEELEEDDDPELVKFCYQRYLSFAKEKEMEAANSNGFNPDVYLPALVQQGILDPNTKSMFDEKALMKKLKRAQKEQVRELMGSTTEQDLQMVDSLIESALSQSKPSDSKSITGTEQQIALPLTLTQQSQPLELEQKDEAKDKEQNEEEKIVKEHHQSVSGTQSEESLQSEDEPASCSERIANFFYHYQLPMILCATSGALSDELLVPVLLQSMPLEVDTSYHLLVAIAGISGPAFFAFLTGMAIKWVADSISEDRQLHPVVKGLLGAAILSVPLAVGLVPFLMDQTCLKAIGESGLYALLILVPAVIGALIGGLCHTHANKANVLGMGVFKPSVPSNCSVLDYLFPSTNKAGLIEL